MRRQVPKAIAQDFQKPDGPRAGRIGAYYRGCDIHIPVADVEHAISQMDMALHGAKGVAGGISTALGTWALIGAFGTASTGTTIATLSGAAATNATLAWLGGGSLAAGGAGMAGGALVFGGLLVIPAVVLTGAFSHLSVHKRVKEIQETITKALLALAEYKETALKLSAVKTRSLELTLVVEKSRALFDGELESIESQLFPNGILSRLFRYFRQIFGGCYFEPQEVEVISPLLQMASALARLVETRILDEHGNLV